MTKETASFIEKLAEKDSKRKKTKDAKKPEDGIVRRLAKNSLIDKDKVKLRESSENDVKEEEEEEGLALFIILLF